MGKLVNLSVRVEPKLKAAFLAACRADRCSGAQVMRAALQTVVDAAHDPEGLQSQLRADANSPAPMGSPAHAMQLVRRVVAKFVR